MKGLKRAPSPSSDAAASKVERPVLYLDIDDTLLRYPEGRDRSPEPASGAREFFSWAVAVFEVRWLSRWCRGGCMPADLVADFCGLLQTERGLVEAIRGIDWTFSDTKLNGIAWLEHLVLGRRFVWIEDDYGVGERELAFLSEHGLDGNWRPCNVTEDPDVLRSVHRELREEC